MYVMKKIQLRNVDLNLLYLFSVLHEERSVSLTAERLFLTPSAVSHALGRLRRMVGDELFKRSGGSMTPTARANDIAERLRVILPQLREAIVPADFDPATTSRGFAIATLPYLTSVFLPSFADAFHRSAANGRLDIRMLDGRTADDIDGGAVDVALGNFRRTPQNLVTEDLFSEENVWVTRRGSLAGRKLTLARLAELPHVDVVFGSLLRTSVNSYDARDGLERLVMQNSLVGVEAAFAAVGHRRDVRWTAPDSLTALRIVAAADAIALVPMSVGYLYADQLGLTVHRAPYKSAPLVIQMLYHVDYSRRPAISWLLKSLRHSSLAFAARLS